MKAWTVGLALALVGCQAPVPAEVPPPSVAPQGPRLQGVASQGLAPLADAALAAVDLGSNQGLALLPEGGAGLRTDAQGAFSVRLAQAQVGPLRLDVGEGRTRLSAVVASPAGAGRRLLQAGGLQVTPATTLVAKLLAPAFRLAGQDPAALARLADQAEALSQRVGEGLSVAQSQRLFDALGEGNGPEELRGVVGELGLQASLAEGLNEAFSALPTPPAGSPVDPTEFPLGPPQSLVEAGLLPGLVTDPPPPGEDPEAPADPSAPEVAGPEDPVQTDATAQGQVQVQNGAVVNTQQPIGLRP